MILSKNREDFKIKFKMPRRNQKSSNKKIDSYKEKSMN